MINTLSQLQINKFPEYVKLWTEKGLVTTPKSLENAIIDFSLFQKQILKKPVAPVVILDSPLKCWIAVNIVKSIFNKSQEQINSQVVSQVHSQVHLQVWSQVASQVWSQVDLQVMYQVQSQVKSQVESQVWSQVNSQIGEQVKSQVGSQVRSQVISQVRSQVNSQIRLQVASQVWSQVNSQVISQVKEQVNSQIGEQVSSQIREQVDLQVWSQVASQVNSQVNSQVVLQVESQVESQVGLQVSSQVNSQIREQVDLQVMSQVWSQIKLNMQEFTFVYPYFDCQFWAGWFSFYEFFRNECGISYPSEYDTFKNCQDYGMVFPLDELCIVCQPPTIIKKNNSGLHCENGPALSYNGDNEIYALNGVVMKKEYVMTPSHDISGEMILKETNTEMRRELLRKVGVERAMDSLPHKLLEKRGNYELYSIDLSNEVKDARYLKMLNPSVGVWHIEGIEPGISTIADALKWRNNNWYEDAEILT